MKKIALAGKYTPEAVEAFRTALADEDCEIAVVNTPEAYAALTDADAMVLRVFKAYKADIERMPSRVCHFIFRKVPFGPMFMRVA